MENGPGGVDEVGSKGGVIGVEGVLRESRRRFGEYALECMPGRERHGVGLLWIYINISRELLFCGVYLLFTRPN